MTARYQMRRASRVTVSIVTPVYNDPRITRCLESVRSQRGEFGIEHIVVDGMSDKETVNAIERHREHVDCLIREPDDGLFDAMNKGIARATGEIVGILNADDRYHDERVLADVTEQMSGTDADACYGDLVYVDNHDEIVRYWESGWYSPWKFYLGWMPPHPTFFARREVYDAYGGFDVELPIAADYDLMLRLLLVNGVSVAYIDRVLVRMATGGQSNSSLRNGLQAVRDMHKSWRKHRLNGQFVAPVLHPIEKIPQYFRNAPIQ
jgi:glycosyltransferase